MAAAPGHKRDMELEKAQYHKNMELVEQPQEQNHKPLVQDQVFVRVEDQVQLYSEDREGGQA